MIRKEFHYCMQSIANYIAEINRLKEKYKDKIIERGTITVAPVGEIRHTVPKGTELSAVTTEMDVPAQIINQRTFIPLRAIAEALGKKVFWDNRGLVIIGDGDNIPDAEYDKKEIDYLVDLTYNY